MDATILHGEKGKKGKGTKNGMLFATHSLVMMKGAIKWTHFVKGF